MSILINGMEMPTSCDNCWALDDYGDYPRCRITEEQRGYNFPIRQKRMDNCPLVPVPPHGRLGDLDEIVRYKERLVVDADKIIPKIRYVVDTKYIVDAPTIIPAEEGKS